MSGGTRKKLNLNTVSVSLDCSSCKRPKLTNLFNPKAKSKCHSFRKQKLDHYSSSSSSKKTNNSGLTEYDSTVTSFSPQYWDTDADYADTKSSMASTVRGFGRVGGESVAVEKDSDDPYLDFRHSMLQMILEKEIYSKEDLKELLNCFLQLNSPYYHGIIIRVFTEIWNGVFSVKSAASPKLHFGCRSRDF